MMQMTMNLEPESIRNLLNKRDYSKSMDLRGVPIGDICVCGSEMFITIVAFHKKELCFYFLDGECANCGSMVTLPYPDDEEDEGEFDAPL